MSSVLHPRAGQALAGSEPSPEAASGGGFLWPRAGLEPGQQGTGSQAACPQVTNEITPVLSYAYLAVLVPVFLLTDYLRYKPVLVLQGLSYVAVWLLLLFGRSVLHLQLMEFCYSVTMAARIAYSSYIFSLVHPARYQRMAGYSRAAVLLGVFTSSVLGQLLVSVGRVSFTTLNHISLDFLAFSLVLALFLKRPRRSLFFNRPKPAPAPPSELAPMRAGPGRGWREWTLVRMMRELGLSLRRPQLRLWSLWWVFNSAGYYLIVYYVHILWSVLQPSQDTASSYNGAADAASTLLGACTSFASGFVKIRWALWAKLVIGVVTAAQASLVFLMYSSGSLSSLWLCYTAFVLFRGAYQFLVPIATFQIASSLSKELCALVFGVNTFLATVLKTVITLIVSDKRGLGLQVDVQSLAPGFRAAVLAGSTPCSFAERSLVPGSRRGKGPGCPFPLLPLGGPRAQGLQDGHRARAPASPARTCPRRLPTAQPRARPPARPPVSLASLFQFFIYFIYFLVLAAAYFLGALLDGLRLCRGGRHQPLPQAQELSCLAEKAQDGVFGGLSPMSPDSTWEQSQLPPAKA
ncbi:Folate transporter 1 [Galemys pyrenaicus]|uniref:Folate transporter 1 n=1 Tax=Galemys pyrenaicus TaxID=202257 RepID=A0A8J6ACN6_GALPY|nr:Folate transporter 1 [Galemys pyrenaicus]